MSDPERRQLALFLFGTGKDGDPPGPLHPGWVQRHLTGTRQTLSRWRANGIPPDRLDDVLAAIRALMPDTQETAAPSMTRRLLTGVIAIEEKVGVSPDELNQAERTVATLLEADARLAAVLEGSRRILDARAGGRAGEPKGGSLGSKRGRPK